MTPTALSPWLDLYEGPADARTAIQRQIDATDRRIDQLVCGLCGWTDEEIAIVVEATRRAFDGLD